MASVSPEDSAPVRSVDDLVSVFHAAEKPLSRFLLGAEAEKFAVHAETFAPLNYDGQHGVVRVLEALTRYGWQPEREVEGGSLVALRRGSASITLEPAAQLELSGAALPDVHAVSAEFDQHLAELGPISEEMKLVWLGAGFQPLARHAELPWVPKQRYPIMREYLPTRGSAAHDMMLRTATVQVNLDYSNEADAMRKLRVGLLLSPLLNALTANSPFVEGRRGGKKSLRGNVWLNMDPARSGLVRRVLEQRHARYHDYVEWALDAGMFLFKRNGKVVANTGQTFRDFMNDGFASERATLGDWKLHLNTLFPEVRLKNTLELRSCDALPHALTPAVSALAAGLFYDERALIEAEDLVASLGLEAIERARPELVTHALGASIAGLPARALGEQLLEVARGGLERRARLDANGASEAIFLDPLQALVQAGLTPADLLLEGLAGDGPFPASELIARCRIERSVAPPAKPAR
jgi:glutamate--cysteine ligase